MTTGIAPESATWRVRWAAEQLGVDPQASPAEARAAFLRRLPEVDFMPPAAWKHALEVLDGQVTESVEADVAALQAEEERLRPEVEAFAEHFWGLGPTQRRRRWQELISRCTFAPALLARLRQLQAGLDVDLAALGSRGPIVLELARCIQTLFVLRPAARAEQRQAFLHTVRQDPEPWQAAALSLRNTFPDLAVLQVDLVGTLASWTAEARQCEEARRTLAYAPPPAPSREPVLGRWLIPIIVGGILMLSRTCLSTSNNTRSGDPYPDSPEKYRYYSPNTDTRKHSPQDLKRMLKDLGMTEEQAKRILEEPNMRQQGENGAMKRFRRPPRLGAEESRRSEQGENGAGNDNGAPRPPRTPGPPSPPRKSP